MDLLIEKALGADDRDVAKVERKTALVDPYKTVERDQLKIPHLKLYDPEDSYDSDKDEVRKSKNGTIEKSWIQ